MNRLIRKKKQRLSPTSVLIWIVFGFAVVMLVIASNTSGTYLRSSLHMRELSAATVTVSEAPNIYDLGGKASLSSEDDKRLLSELTKSPPPGSLKCPEGFTAIYDRIVDEGNSTTKPKIPKILHLSYNNRCVPSEVFGSGVQQWMDELPEYSIYYHDDAAVDRLLAAEWQEFPHLHRMSKCIQYKGAMKIDLWRILVVYRFGGLYSDIDNVPEERFKHGEVIDPEDTFFSSSDSWNRPNQNVFAMEPFHPIAVFTIETILKNLFELESVRQPKVVFVTGPAALRDGYLSFLLLSFPSKPRGELLHPGVIKGYLGKQLHKEGVWDWGNPIGKNFVEHDGMNMTAKDRDHLLADTTHWSKEVYRNRKGVDFPCRSLLYQLDHPSATNSIASNWTVLGG